MLTCCTSCKSVINLTYSEQLQFSLTMYHYVPMVLFDTPSIIILNITKFGVSLCRMLNFYVYSECIYAECHYAQCHFLCTMPNSLKTFSLVLVKSACMERTNTLAYHENSCITIAKKFSVLKQKNCR
jgi:hypothetical protein